MMAVISWLSIGAAVLLLLFVVIGIHFAAVTGAEISPDRRKRDDDLLA